MFLSGVFFPREQLPGFMQAIAQWLPLTAAVELVRPLFLGQLPAHGLQHLTVLVAYAVGGFWVALALTRKRFKA
jgi:lipooligosaccharide transport system permease protein